jgi:hypothetical protein
MHWQPKTGAGSFADVVHAAEQNRLIIPAPAAAPTPLEWVSDGGAADTMPITI